MRKFTPVLLLAMAPVTAFGAADTDDTVLTMEEITVPGVRQRLHRQGTLKDVIRKTEVIDEAMMESRQAVNLSGAIAESPGVRVSNECSVCGVKRVMLNGMRGEHTSILTDGIPLHTMLSGYYAVDAIATTGVSRIEVARGAGASLIAPEAIGGTINVISRTPVTTGLELDISAEHNGDYTAGVFGGLVSESGNSWASLTLQSDRHDQVDEDSNRVSEAPRQQNNNLILRLSHDVSARDNVLLRVGITESEIFGGPTFADDIDEVLAGYDGIESAQLFEQNDVRREFIGKAWETAEWIDTGRLELASSWLHEFNPRYNATVSLAWSRHKQDSFYEGFDYAATNNMFHLELRNNYALNDAHLLTFGVDWRHEKMRSESRAGEASLNYIEDSFDYDLAGLYLQDTWTINPALELALALRIDKLRADFVAEQKPGVEIAKVVPAPRLDLRYLHSDRWTSRLSAGIGYRAPLSFFETDHGILDAGDGYAIDVDTLERSLSAAYAISFEGTAFSSTLSLAYTRVKHLSALDETDAGVPLLTQLDDTARVIAADLVLGYSVNDWLTLGLTLEQYDYDDNFRRAYVIAPVERRLITTADINHGPWTGFVSANRVGGRDLSRYGYAGFNIAGDATSAKSARADAYWVVDMRLAYNWNDRISLYAGAANLFDYTQVRKDETPLFWDPDGAYDVAYITGPLRGRELYLGMEINF
ncbi:MAG: TonB-dependent receptor plug domain-containing protein [Gammaproteobacteria bacterium]